MSKFGAKLKSICNNYTEKVNNIETQLINYEDNLNELENYITNKGFIFEISEVFTAELRLSVNVILTLPKSLYKLHFIYELANGIPYIRLIGISGQSPNRRYPVQLAAIKRHVLNVRFGPSRHRITVNNKEDNEIFFDLFKTILSADKESDLQSIINIMRILEENSNVEKVLKGV